MEKMVEQEDTDRDLAIVQNAIGVRSDGWTSHEGYEAAVATAAAIRQSALDQADDDAERESFRGHWPFDDFDEDGLRANG